MKIVAVKAVNINEQDKRRQLTSELEAFSYFSSPYVTDFFGAFFDFSSNQIHIVLEYMKGGSVMDLVEKRQGKVRPAGRPVSTASVVSAYSWESICRYDCLSAYLYIHDLARAGAGVVCGCACSYPLSLSLFSPIARIDRSYSM